MTPTEMGHLIGACDQAMEFIKPYETIREAWDNCEIGEWMLWFAARIKIPFKMLVEARAECAGLCYMMVDDPNTEEARMIAIHYAAGAASMHDLRSIHNTLWESARNARMRHFEFTDTYGRINAELSANRYGIMAMALAVYKDIENKEDYTPTDIATTANVASQVANCFADSKGDREEKAKVQKQMADLCRELLTDVVMWKLNKLEAEEWASLK